MSNVAEQEEMLQANKQTTSMLIIDKKRMKLKGPPIPAPGDLAAELS